MMGMYPAKLENWGLNSDRYDTYPTVKAAIKDYVEQMRQNTDIIDAFELSYPADAEHDGEWEEVFTIGNLKGKGKGNATGKGKNTTKQSNRGHNGKQANQKDTE